MKRSSSPSSPNPTEINDNEDTEPIMNTPSKKAKTTSPKLKSTSSSPKTPKKAAANSSTDSQSPSEKNTPSSNPWTPDKKERFLEKIFALGLKGCNVDEICQEFGLTKLQFRNATQSGRKGNLRDKACKAIRGD